MNKLLDFFKVDFPYEIKWKHAVNSSEELKGALLSDVMMIEGDIQCINGNIIMAHPPLESSNISFVEWFKEIELNKKGAKLDFKDKKSILPVLLYLRKKNISIPVFLHADILKGPGGKIPLFNSEEFINLCNNLFPQAVLSLGWTTGYEKTSSFSKEDIEKMIFFASKSISDHITLSIRTTYLINSWDNVKKIYDFNKLSITLWNVEVIDNELKKFIKNNVKREKTFLDLRNNIRLSKKSNSLRQLDC